MKQLRTDKYSLAWFKLAECVSRKEKERALGVYRLLSHSIQDSAFAVQLEGDLLLAFQDTAGARNKYLQASQLYAKQDSLAQSAAVFEHMLMLGVPTIEELQHMTDLAAQLKLTNKIQHYAGLLVQTHAKQKDFDHISHLINTYRSQLSSQELVLLYRTTVLALVQHKASHDTLSTYLHDFLDLLVIDADHHALQRVLGELHMVSPQVHEQACHYLETQHKK